MKIIVSIAVFVFMIVVSPACKRAVRESKGTNIRIVSLAPSITEMICALGGERFLVGRTSACDYPLSVTKVKVIGGFGAPSLELLAATSPTLVLDTALADTSMASQIQAMGLHREEIKCKQIDDIPNALTQIGNLINHQEEAKKMANQIKAEIEVLREKATIPHVTPSVYVEIWNDPMMTLGRKSFLSELIRLAGGRNIGDSVDMDYFKTSSEWLIDNNPDIILCMYMSKDTPAAKMIPKRAGWQNINAVKNHRIYDGLPNNIVLRPGPRVVEGIKVLKKYISDTQ